MPATRQGLHIFSALTCKEKRNLSILRETEHFGKLGLNAKQRGECCLSADRAGWEETQNVLEKNLASGKHRAVPSYLDGTELNSVWLRPGKRELPRKTSASQTCTNASLGPPFPLRWGTPHGQASGSSPVPVCCFFQHPCQLLPVPPIPFFQCVSWCRKPLNLRLYTKWGLAAFTFCLLSL